MKYPQCRWEIIRPGILIPVFFLFLYTVSRAQVHPANIGHNNPGGILSVNGNPNWNILNPAGLGDQETRNMYAEHSRPFTTREIGVSALAFRTPVYRGCFSISAACYGIKGFREFNYALAYGMKLGEKFSGGVRFAYDHTSALEQWNYLWTMGISAGIFYSPGNKTTLGIYLQYPVNVSSYPGYGSVSPASISTGISHMIYTNTWIMGEFTMLSEGYLQLKTALEYMPFEGISFRVGYHSSPDSFSIGISYSLQPLTLLLSFAWMSTPGLSPAVGLSYAF